MIVKPFSLLLLLMLVSCAAAYEQVTTSDGYEIHSFRRAYANTHLIKIKAGGYLMIDSGGYDEAANLVDDLRSHGINPHEIRAIIITHGHWDHAAGARYFQEEFKTKVIAGLGDKGILTAGHSDPLCPTGFLARMRVANDQGVSFKPPAVTTWIDQETDLQSLVGIPGRAVPIPSHTKGSLAVVIGQSAFVGDLFRGSLIGSSPAVHFYICDIEANRKFIAAFLRGQASSVQGFYPGHFGPRIERQDVSNYFDLVEGH